MIKKRSGSHEDTIREYRIGNAGLSIGQPLTDFLGVLRGVPTYNRHNNPLLDIEGETRSSVSSGGEPV